MRKLGTRGRVAGAALVAGLGLTLTAMPAFANGTVEAQYNPHSGDYWTPDEHVGPVEVHSIDIYQGTLCLGEQGFFVPGTQIPIPGFWNLCIPAI